jgi:large subunit ribosomal protein L37Ae
MEEESRKSRKCPSCGKDKLARKSAGIWKCKSCENIFAGGAFLSIPKRKKTTEGEE